ncbi:hypothetical protein [Legionella bononiensis]|uniref:Uncharacterized protein n=1 Tax=Legionella bononiensis TaxID=2793102 RepID=A0ABS1W731_9GAMM|nr:hypothetical protein [Legionella bononiensis]MBL7481267.1 hypothetical protein [Legionella bononiensis]MBL7525172.1 hypothetical protein [Legionella bononiensis]MBL7562896.1 hypothetical protein [Legionella bononiensis]
MLGLFNQDSQWKKGLQLFNLFLLSTATYKLLTDPDAQVSAEGLEITVHALNFLSLREHSSVLSELLTVGVNLFSLGASYSRMTSETTHTSPLIDALGVVSTVLNTGALISGSTTAYPENPSP